MADSLIAVEQSAREFAKHFRAGADKAALRVGAETHAQEAAANCFNEIADRLAALPKQEWRPIETAPEVNGDYFFCRLAWGAADDMTEGDGLRWRGKWFASAVFNSIGKDRNFGFRETEVQPTHWMPLPPPPTVAKEVK